MPMASLAKLPVIDLPEFLTIDTCIIDARFIEQYNTGQHKGFPFMHNILGSSTERLATFVTDTRIKKTSDLTEPTNDLSKQSKANRLLPKTNEIPQADNLTINSNYNNHLINAMETNTSMPAIGLVPPEVLFPPPLRDDAMDLPMPIISSVSTPCTMILSSASSQTPILSTIVAPSSSFLNTTSVADASPLNSLIPDSTLGTSDQNCVVLISCGTMTDDDRQPSRDRETQTVDTVKIDAATQCNEDDFEWDKEIAIAATQQTENEESGKEESAFNLFLKEKIYTYPNGKIECCICGEISAKKKSMELHMKIHWGPSVLCCYCGGQYEHEQLLRDHVCAGKPMRVRCLRYKCPSYKCDAVAISLLELYEHINEHLGERNYRCKRCEFSFATREELQCHCMLNKACKREKKVRVIRYYNMRKGPDRVIRKRVFFVRNGTQVFIVKKPLPGFKSQGGQRQRCPVCLKWCFRRGIYQKHFKSCVKKHRYIRKNKKIATPHEKT